VVVAVLFCVLFAAVIFFCCYHNFDSVAVLLLKKMLLTSQIRKYDKSNAERLLAWVSPEQLNGLLLFMPTRG
jgi:hypothetical protein